MDVCFEYRLIKTIIIMKMNTGVWNNENASKTMKNASKIIEMVNNISGSTLLRNTVRTRLE